MSTITSSISSLLSSFLDILRALLNALLATFQSIFNLARDALTAVFDLMSGVVGFVFGNIVIIGVVVAAFVGYSAYRQKHQGGGVAGGVKKTS